MLDNIDKQIVTQLQVDFPIAENPYDIIAERLGLDSETVFQRVVALVDAGTIRRVGVSIDSRRMGYASTLAAVRVTDAKIAEACGVIDSYPEITHSYLRSNEFNIWFTVIAVDAERVKEVLEELGVKLGIGESDVLDLPVKQLFKLDARFKPT